MLYVLETESVDCCSTAHSSGPIYEDIQLNRLLAGTSKTIGDWSQDVARVPTDSRYLTRLSSATGYHRHALSFEHAEQQKQPCQAHSGGVWPLRQAKHYKLGVHLYTNLPTFEWRLIGVTSLKAFQRTSTHHPAELTKPKFTTGTT
eukprot:4267984-Pleurochrysis_carterae.AAC.5